MQLESGNTYNVTIPTPSLGSHNLRYYVNDTLGNMNSSVTDSFTVSDTTPPSITITSPENTTYEISDTPVISYNAGEAISDDYYSIDGGANNSFVNGSTTLDLSALGLGQHNITIYANDTSNNWGSDVEWFTVIYMPPDTTPPTISFVSPTPENNTVVDVNYVYVNITASEPLSTALLDWNGMNETMLGSGTNWYLNKTSLTGGVYTYRVWGNDTSGNRNLSEARVLTVAVVNQPPTADAGLDQSSPIGVPVLFDGSGSTDDTGIVLYEWDFDGDGVYDSTGVTASHTYYTLGTHTVVLRVTDADGLTDTDTAIVDITLSGEGHVLSKNPDFSTQDSVYSLSDTIFIKAWSDRVDYNDLKKAEVNFKCIKLKVQLNNNHDGTYDGGTLASNLPLGNCIVDIKLEDNARTRYRGSETITIVQ